MTKNYVGLKSDKGEPLGAKIELLKNAAHALLHEVSTLGIPREVDVRSGVDLYEEIRRYEMRLIQQALLHAGGNQVRAARLLNVNATTLNSKIKRFNIPIGGELNGSNTNGDL